MTQAEELFDVVDGEDRVLRVMPRSEVHRRRLRHRAVHIFVRRSDGQLLIHKRSTTKEEFPGVWTSSASGHVASGESYISAARRELTEELGISGQLIRLSKFAACEDTCFEFTELFGVHSDQTIQHDPVEIAEICWTTLQDVASWMSRSPDDFSPAFRLLLRWYLQNEGAGRSTE